MITLKIIGSILFILANWFIAARVGYICGRNDNHAMWKRLVDKKISKTK